MGDAVLIAASGFLLGFLRGVAGLVLALVLYCLFYADQNALTRAIVRKYTPKLTERQTTRSVKGEGQLHDAPVQEMVVAEDIDYDRMPHKRTPYNLPRQEVDR